MFKEMRITPIRDLCRAPGAALAVLSLVFGLSGEAASESTFDCVMDPAMTVRIGSEVAGLLDEVAVDRGDLVKKDQVLARISSGVEAANVARAKARAAGSAEIEAQKSRLGFSRKQLNRTQKLAAKKIVTQQRIDELVAEVRVGEHELQQAILRKRLAGLELARAEAELDQRTVRSPIDGIVTQRHLSPGEFVFRESHIVTLAQLDLLLVEAFLPVALYRRVRLGTTGIVRPNEPIGGEYEASVTIVDRVFDTASDTFGVRLELANPGQILPGGQRCRVTFQIDATN